MKKIKAYDLDGVFIPDLELNFYSTSIFEVVWSLLRPTFVPDEKILIVTMRNNRMEDVTHKWLGYNKFKIESIIFLGDDRNIFSKKASAMAKTDYLNENSDKIECYYESDPEIVDFMRNHFKCEVPVIHFAEFIKKYL